MTQKEQQIIDILITAIKGGNLIRFEYKGQIRINLNITAHNLH
jgi:hypothetical protein